jgi:hypothetical protein
LATAARESGRLTRGAWKYVRTGVQEQQVRGLGAPGPLHAGPVLPHPPGGQRGLVEHRDPRIAAGDVGGAVGGAAVDDDDLEIRVRLPSEGLQASADRLGLVPGRDDHAHPRSGGRGVRARGHVGHLEREVEGDPLDEERHAGERGEGELQQLHPSAEGAP